MFKFLAKSAIASLIWSKYHKIIVSTILLFILYFIISFIHDDYLEYAELSEETTNVALSYILKWGALITATAIYYFTNIYKFKAPETAAETSSAKPEKAKKSKHKEKAKQQDPFAEIRNKEKLNSKADIALRKSKS